MIRVRALERGFYDGVIRDAGVEFGFDDQKVVDGKKVRLGSWMEPLEQPKPVGRKRDAEDVM